MHQFLYPLNKGNKTHIRQRIRKLQLVMKSSNLHWAIYKMVASCGHTIQICFVHEISCFSSFLVTKAAFMLILRGQNQRFETLIKNADPKRRSREYCLCFPREEDDFVSMHCALFEAIVRAQVNRKGVYMTSFKRGYM